MIANQLYLFLFLLFERLIKFFLEKQPLNFNFALNRVEMFKIAEVACKIFIKKLMPLLPNSSFLSLIAQKVHQVL